MYRSLVILFVLLQTSGRPVAAEANYFEPFYFALTADPHISRFDNTMESRLTEMRQRINAMAIAPAFVVAAGDLLNESTPTLYARFKLTTQGYQVPYYTVPGNHDIDPVKFPAATLAAYREHMGPDYFRVTHNNCDFYFLNSVVLRDRATYGAEYDEQWDWLHDKIAQTAGRAHTYFICHHPPFLDRINEGGGDLGCCGGGYYNWPPAERSRLLSLLVSARGSVVFAGHYHRDRTINNSGFTVHIPTGPQLDFDHNPAQQRLTWRLVKVFGNRVESIRMVYGEADITAPAAPQNVRALRVTNGTIKVECDPASDATGVLYYDLYLNGGRVSRALEAALDAVVPAGLSVHEFTVRAVDPYGNQSDPSAPLMYQDAPIDTGTRDWSRYE